MQHRDSITLQKIVSEADFVIEMLSGVAQNEFSQNEILKRAAAMSLINIGELVKNLTPEVRNQYDNVPWKAISGFRDVAAHKYGTLDMDIVYNTVKLTFLILKTALRKSCPNLISTSVVNVPMRNRARVFPLTQKTPETHVGFGSFV